MFAKRQGKIGISFVIAAASLSCALMMLAGITIATIFPHGDISAFLGSREAELDARNPGDAKAMLFITVWIGLLSFLLLCSEFRKFKHKKADLTFEEKVEAKMRESKEEHKRDGGHL